ncbi:MAG: hypothetical protein L0226_12045, partial [Acidobacteria bacterium]|nr:hypothetical protein [Acidobacteriota bacterium]
MKLKDGIDWIFPSTNGFCGCAMKREYETNENRRNKRKTPFLVCFVYFRLFRILSSLHKHKIR